MKKLLFLSVVLSSVFMSYSQTEFIRKEKDFKGSVIFVEIQRDSIKSMKESVSFLKQLHSVSSTEEFVLGKMETDELKFTHQYYDQYYKGIRVAYSNYSVHGRGDIINTANGTYNKVGEVNIVPKLSEKEALNDAIRFIGAETYKWELPEEERWLKEYYNRSYYPEGELVIVKDRLKTDSQFRLAWKFNIYAHKPLSHDLIYVDAITGDILDVESKIYFSNYQGSATTRYSGSRNIMSDSFTGGFRLREIRNNVRIETYNMKNRGKNYSMASDFTDNDNNWTSTEFNNANMDNAALDAHWGAEMTYQYFWVVHNRNSWNGSGAPMLNYVHADMVAFKSSDVNAFWDGVRVTYGDGDSCWDPLTSIDIVAHEFAHGINESTAKMRYEGESGALNESLSDIWAACVEVYTTSDKETWLFGEDVALCQTPLRSISDPKILGQPNTYPTNPLVTGSTPFWQSTSSDTDHGGVHTNSGVGNFWFYLLVNGGAGTNDNENDYSVQGIGIDAAARIVYRAETDILYSNHEQSISYNQLRNATIIAASNIYGSTSDEVISVTNAWYAVGVGNQYQYPISGPNQICDQATYTIDNLPTGATITWGSSGSGGLGRVLFLVSGQGTPTAVFRKIFPGNHTIYANITLNGNTIRLEKNNITTGTPSIPSSWIDNITPSYSTLGYVTYPICFSPLGSNPSYYIQFDDQGYSSMPYLGYDVEEVSGSSVQIVKGLNCLKITPTRLGTKVIRVRAHNACGESDPLQITINVQDCLPGPPSPGTDPITLSCYPNPADDVLNVSIEEETQSLSSSRSLADKPVYTIRLWSGVRGLVRTVEAQQGAVTQISLQGLPSGLYFVHIIKDGEILRKQIIQKR